MNTPITTRAKSFIKCCSVVAVLAAPLASAAEWKVDLSRRQKTVRDRDAREPQGAPAGERTVLDALFDPGEPTQELVILNTEKGFLPPTVRARKGGKYLVHVVNVNEKEKNVSFVLDGFSEHHSTFYGKVKSFRLEPRKEGVFSFNCPETSAEGRLVIHAPKGAEPPAADLRRPASSER